MFLVFVEYNDELVTVDLECLWNSCKCISGDNCF